MCPAPLSSTPGFLYASQTARLTACFTHHPAFSPLTCYWSTHYRLLKSHISCLSPCQIVLSLWNIFCAFFMFMDFCLLPVLWIFYFFYSPLSLQLSGLFSFLCFDICLKTTCNNINTFIALLPPMSASEFSSRHLRPCSLWQNNLPTKWTQQDPPTLSPHSCPEEARSSYWDPTGGNSECKSESCDCCWNS